MNNGKKHQKYFILPKMYIWLFILCAGTVVANNYKVMYIEGTMGSGKTTFLKTIKSTFENRYEGLCFVEEPHEALNDSGIFNSDLSDPANLAILQALFMKLYTHQLIQLIKMDHCKIIFVDRSIHSCYYVFLEKYHQALHVLYKSYLSDHVYLFSTKHEFIFINTPPTEALQRIIARKRSDAETLIQLSYIQTQYERLITMFEILDVTVHKFDEVDLMIVIENFIKKTLEREE